MNNHLCILWCYNNTEHIKQCFESAYLPTMDYFIVENKSPNSAEISEYFLSKRLAGYIQFEENIADNAVKIFFRDFRFFIARYAYFTFSDCDLVLDDAEKAFSEIRNILSHREVGVCAVNLKLDNFPHNIAKPSDWLPPAVGECDLYTEVPTGSHFATTTKGNMGIFTLAPRGIDDEFRKMCAARGLKWTRTKEASAYHLTWDYYHPGHPYFDFRKKNPNIFAQNKTCAYKKLI